MKDLLAKFGLDAIVGLDAETFYDPKDKYSLRKMATTEYVVDPRFKLHCWACQADNDSRATVQQSLSKVDYRQARWSRIGVLCHHAHFDGLILSHHYGIHPKMFFDTLSMARLVMPVQVPLNLDGLAKALGLPGKKGAESLEAIAGIRDLSPKQYANLAKYAGNDIEQTWAIFRKLLPFVPDDELRLIDITVKMYTRPTVLINRAMVERVNENEISNKAAMVDGLRTTAKALGSADQFAELLRKAGVEPPTKTNKNGHTVYAFAKNDLAFKALANHPRKKVRDLVTARFATKSTLMEKRSARMVSRTKLLKAQPIYLNYWGARRTGRWSGSDKMNWQNFNRGSDMRKAVKAPPGHRFIIADQRQIEARMTRWIVGDAVGLKRFADFDAGIGPDVYVVTASGIYKVPVDKISKLQRFAGKVADLSCQYGVGAPKFANTLRTGSMGPPMEITDEDALEVVQNWRQNNPSITNGWKRAETVARTAFLGQQKVSFGGCEFHGDGDRGFIVLPNGTMLRYDGLQTDDYGGISYVSRVSHLKSGHINVERTKLYGGLLIENMSQALSRALLAEQMVKMAKLPVHIASCTHDEVLLVVKTERAKEIERKVTRIMSIQPAWAKGLPLSVETQVSAIYSKE